MIDEARKVTNNISSNEIKFTKFIQDLHFPKVY